MKFLSYIFMTYSPPMNCRLPSDGASRDRCLSSLIDLYVRVNVESCLLLNGKQNCRLVFLVQWKNVHRIFCFYWYLTNVSYHYIEHTCIKAENREFRRICGSKRDEVAGYCKIFHNEELHNLYSVSDITEVLKSARTVRNTYTFSQRAWKKETI
jgi:hypothetical protein